MSMLTIQLVLYTDTEKPTVPYGTIAIVAGGVLGLIVITQSIVILIILFRRRKIKRLFIVCLHMYDGDLILQCQC